MSYVNENYIPFIMRGGGSGANVRRVTYYENISDELKPSEIAQMAAIINSTNSYLIEVDFNGAIYPASYSITNSMIVIWFIDEMGSGFRFIHCVPEFSELVYGYEKWKFLTYGPQTLNDEQKAQARENIGALGEGDVSSGLPDVAPKSETELFPEDDYLFALDESSGFYMFSYSPSPITLVDGCDYRVLWDGTDYYCTAVLLEGNGSSVIVLGNLSMLDSSVYEDTKEPFIVLYMVSADGSSIIAYTTDTDDTNKIGFYKVGTSPDEEKFLQVVNGKATWVTIELAEDGGF